jgi:uncharacterized membrane protein HdeD (DUF308 family)
MMPAQSALSPSPHGLPKPRRRTLFVFGCLLTLLGAVAVFAPNFGHVLIGGLVGWLLWLAGAFTLGGTLLLQVGMRAWIGALSSLFAIAAGIFLLAYPTVGAYAVALVLTSAFLVDGAFQMALALGLRPLKVWRWVLASALASILAALAIGASLVTDRASMIGLFLGVAIFSTGAAFIAMSRADRR